jgi:hypothetical protein
MAETVGITHVSTTALCNKPSCTTISPRVVIWDLDETLIIFDSLRDGKFAAAHGKDDATGREIGAGLSRLLMALLDGIFSFRELEGVDIGSLVEFQSSLGSSMQGTADESIGEASSAKRPRPDESSLRADPAAANPSTASLVARAADVYAGGEARLATLVPAGWLAARRLLLDEVEEYTDGWLAAAATALNVSSNDAKEGDTEAAANEAARLATPVAATPSQVNLVVTASHWVAALGKLLLFGLANHVHARDVFSAVHRTKAVAFEAALVAHASTQTVGLPQGAGEEAVVVFAVGDGAEEEAAAADLAIPFVCVRTAKDLASGARRVLVDG